jgi:membrane-bound ClpP family serine protease
MSLGLGIVLFVIGAVLAFALQVSVDWIDLQLVGYILMAAGAVVVILSLVLMARRRRSVATSQTSVDPSTGDRITRSEQSRPEEY